MKGPSCSGHVLQSYCKHYLQSYCKRYACCEELSLQALITRLLPSAGPGHRVTTRPGAEAWALARVSTRAARASMRACICFREWIWRARSLASSACVRDQAYGAARAAREHTPKHPANMRVTSIRECYVTLAVLYCARVRDCLGMRPSIQDDRDGPRLGLTSRHTPPPPPSYAPGLLLPSCHGAAAPTPSRRRWGPAVAP